MSLLTALHGRTVHDRRTRVLASHLAPLLPQGAGVVDVGCGDGRLAARVLSLRPDVRIRGLEVKPRAGTAIEVADFDGLHLPLADGEADLVMLVDVLHHAQAPEALLAEAVRAARHGVLVKDHTRDGLLAGPTLRFMDRVGNAGHGVALPYNYWSRAEWDHHLGALGLEAEAWIDDLGLYPFPASLAFDRGLHFIAHFVRVES